MSYADRFTEDLVSTPIDAPPTSLPALLNVLGVRDAAPEAQDVAIDGWLADHEPDGLLRWELQWRGTIAAA